MEIAGFVAWLAWPLVRVYYLIGFKNRLQVMWEWTWSYIRFRRGARLIVNKGRRTLLTGDGAAEPPTPRPSRAAPAAAGRQGPRELAGRERRLQ